MKIISTKVNDYYDCCINQFGFDEGGNTFVRNPEWYEVYTTYRSRWEKSHTRPPHKNDRYCFLVNGLSERNEFVKDRIRHSANFFRIVFAGKIYGGIEFKYPHQFSTPGNIELSAFLYTYDSFVEFVTQFGIEIDKMTSRRIFDDNCSISVSEKIKKHFEVIDVLQECATKKIVLGHIKRTDYHSYEVSLNCSLKEYQFYKVLDPFTAFQELAMFVDGYLAFPGNEMIEILDKYKIESHGFDKMSFRKHPTKKK
jgi:hypothetical protein